MISLASKKPPLVYNLLDFRFHDCHFPQIIVMNLFTDKHYYWLIWRWIVDLAYLFRYLRDQFSYYFWTAKRYPSIIKRITGSLKIYISAHNLDLRCIVMYYKVLELKDLSVEFFNRWKCLFRSKMRYWIIDGTFYDACWYNIYQTRTGTQLTQYHCLIICNVAWKTDDYIQNTIKMSEITPNCCRITTILALLLENITDSSYSTSST